MRPYLGESPLRTRMCTGEDRRVSGAFSNLRLWQSELDDVGVAESRGKIEHRVEGVSGGGTIRRQHRLAR